MKLIYSKIEPTTLLHIIHKANDFFQNRVDLVDADQPLQVSALVAHKGKTFRPHKHIYCEKTTTTTQESWVVIKGKVQAILYDLDDQIIAKEILEPGDVSITLRGGHNYLMLEDNTFVYEYKTGPYLGQENDKVFID